MRRISLTKAFLVASLSTVPIFGASLTSQMGQIRRMPDLKQKIHATLSLIPKIPEKRATKVSRELIALIRELTDEILSRHKLDEVTAGMNLIRQAVRERKISRADVSGHLRKSLELLTREYSLIQSGTYVKQEEEKEEKPKKETEEEAQEVTQEPGYVPEISLSDDNDPTQPFSFTVGLLDDPSDLSTMPHKVELEEYDVKQFSKSLRVMLLMQRQIILLLEALRREVQLGVDKLSKQSGGTRTRDLVSTNYQMLRGLMSDIKIVQEALLRITDHLRQSQGRSQNPDLSPSDEKDENEETVDSDIELEDFLEEKVEVPSEE